MSQVWRRDRRSGARAPNCGGTRPRALCRPRHALRRRSGFPTSRRLWLRALLLLLPLLGFSGSPGPACFPPPGPPQPAPVFCASAASAEGGGSMLSPQRTAAVASRGAGEASSFPWTGSAVTHAASQGFGSEVTTRRCRRSCSCGDVHCPAGCLRSQFRAGGSGSGQRPRPQSRAYGVVRAGGRAARGSGRSSSALSLAGRAGRAAARSGVGKPSRETVSVNGPGSAGRWIFFY